MQESTLRRRIETGACDLPRKLVLCGRDLHRCIDDAAIERPHRIWHHGVSVDEVLGHLRREVPARIFADQIEMLELGEMATDSCRIVGNRCNLLEGESLARAAKLEQSGDQIPRNSSRCGWTCLKFTGSRSAPAATPALTSACEPVT